MNRSWILALLVGGCVPLAGCGSTTRVVQNNETCGRQMTDLQNALASGAMTQHEYERARREAIKRCDKSS
ncbi:hypothetical protein ISN76_14785 [Dyella halodurans]|uniref:SHOCT domain-containing protein n=1 Tax=Dyella halodurans TaxID=1920171 RepID=A0ABV9C797_9GAMM|nr:hypothetical protein [Dyella halodurans]